MHDPWLGGEAGAELFSPGAGAVHPLRDAAPSSWQATAGVPVSQPWSPARATEFAGPGAPSAANAFEQSLTSAYSPAALLDLAPEAARAAHGSPLSYGDVASLSALDFRPPFSNPPPATQLLAGQRGASGTAVGSGQALPVNVGIPPASLPFGAAPAAFSPSYLQPAPPTETSLTGSTVAAQGLMALSQASPLWPADPSHADVGGFQQRADTSSWLPWTASLFRVQTGLHQRKADAKLLTVDSATTVVFLAVSTIFLVIMVPVISVVMHDAFVRVPKWRRAGMLETMGSDEVFEVDLGDPVGMVPAGNIFRHCARTSERLKHQHDINRQVMEIAEDEHIANLLDDYPWPKDHELLDTIREERQYKLSHLLVEALESVQQSAEAHHHHHHHNGGSPRPRGHMKGIEFLIDVLKAGPGNPRFRGTVVLPNNPASVRNWTKDRFMATLLGAAMIMAPLFMLVAYKDIFHEHFLTEPIGQRLSIAELTCLGPADQACSTMLGAVFLVFILEYERFVVRKEKQAFLKMRWLPGDKLWMRLGQVCNGLCLLFTAMVIPLVFWSEQDTKDIVFDSMGMLFIFGMDDLSSEAMSYLEMSDEDFQASYADFLLMLLHCPLNMEDLVDYDAKTAEGIWILDFSEGDGIFCTLRDAESGKPEPCFTRLFLTEGKDKAELVYSVHRDDSRLLGAGTSIISFFWEFVYWVLILAELTFPMTYLLMGDPCYD